MCTIVVAWPYSTCLRGQAPASAVRVNSNVRPHELPAFELYPTSKPDGSFAAAWFDDEACLWGDDRLLTAEKLAAQWTAPKLRLHGPKQTATPVLFNPNALAVSKSVCDLLKEFEELEFLPVSVSGHGQFYILHVINAIDLPPGSQARVAPAPSGNIVEIHAFPEAFTPPQGFFRVLQPAGSASRRIGPRTTKAVYLGPRGCAAVEQAASGYLEPRRR